MAGSACTSWQVRERDAEAQARLEAAGYPAALARVYAGRGISGPEALDYRLTGLLAEPPMKGIEEAAAVLGRAILAGERIVIVGDYDADGATATALGMATLAAMGADVDHTVADRFRIGYGLTPEAVEAAAEKEPAVLVTVDNGISNTDGVAMAREHGMRVVITDHHLPPDELPDADAIVNPNQPGCPFPAKATAGVGVLFYVLARLRRWLVEQGHLPGGGPNLADYLDLVAVGTVADVVDLDRNNRILVHQGLARIQAGRARPGLHALLEVAGRDPAAVTATDIAFAVGPRINAAGRLADSATSVECLLAPDRATAEQLANQLDATNRERRAIEQNQTDEALAEADALDVAEGYGVAVYRSGWHEGVVGLIAGRLRERTHRPVVAFAEAGDGLIKGSARSIPGVHIRDVLATMAANHPELITRFGGHAMAAGLSIPADQFEVFQVVFDLTVQDHADTGVFTPILETDGELAPDELTLATAEALRDGGPWGKAFPEPVFEGTFEVRKAREVGNGHLKLKVRPVQGGPVFDAIHFRGMPEEGESAIPRNLELAYQIERDDYFAEPRVQLIVVDRRPSQAQRVTEDATPAHSTEETDHA